MRISQSGTLLLPIITASDLRGTTYTEWFGWDGALFGYHANVYNRKNILAENYRVNRPNPRIRDPPNGDAANTSHDWDWCEV